MADPYNPYTSYPTPTPGGVSYYPPAPDEQSYHQGASPYGQPQYSNVDHGGHGVAPPDQAYAYPPQSSTHHLQPDGYQHNAPSAGSYTPVGQPDYLGPVSPLGMPPHGSGGKVPENLGYYESHPADVPRYTPSHSPRPPAPPVYVSDADNAQSHDGKRDTSDGEDLEGDRGFGGSLAGGAAGYYFGHKKDHGLLGAIGGAIIGNLLEDKVKKHERSSSPSSSHGSHHSHHSHHSHLGHGHHHHHHSHRHSRSRSHSRHREADDY
ncbi:uncharacterized protein N7469_008223 [Penicillium citrinum]|uniref:Glycine zipper 2TM domain-containing protein n=2 Tax=Penicillium TaxID=5073 RepID=A0A9W9TKN5_PENCI|nr:uncharacterized protein N7469_008223 [Penicillium citrinum]KAJ5224720.1 hypothetical protein N7469_008223 [Penicillium citrinum]KAJ5574974.1 hypothetical protein N7450_008873 [Penicillium hetheringtonii]KAK5796248.1 hypothetical protein VI817_005533 [Penicillium citrinum]